MFSKVEWFLALKFMRSKRKDGFISVVSFFSLIGIIIGVATLIVVMSVMNGFHKEFLRNILGIQGHITVVNREGDFKDYNEITKRLLAIDGVKFVAPMVIGQGMVINGSYSSGVFIRGMDPEQLFEKPSIRESVSHDVEVGFKEGEGVMVGSALATQLRIRKGDNIKLISASGNSSILGFIPRIKTLRVAGIFDLGLYQYNLTTIFMPLSEAQTFFKHEGSVTEIEVMVKEPEDLEGTKALIAEKLGEEIDIIDWRKSQATFLNSLEVERSVMFIILTLIIIVAVFNIVSSMIMLVKDKAQNIAVLRTLGATRESVMRIFILAGSLIGVVGTLSGTVVGVLFSLNIDRLKQLLENLCGITLFDPVIYFLNSLPSELEVSSVLVICFLSMLLSFLATIYPAFRAARMMPAQVLRYE